MSHRGTRRGQEISTKVEERNCLLVLGMHRSGTSALTRVLSIAGANLPATLLGKAGSNKRGHWESIPLIRYHDALLTELGGSWADWRSVEIARVPEERREEIRGEIADILKAEYGSAPLFVIKDPRICRFTPLFLDALEKAGIETRVALTIRNPLEVSGSLESRDGLGRTHSALLWLRHTLEAEAATRGMSRAIISFDSLLRDWKACLEDLSAQLGVRWPCTPAGMAPQVEEFLTPTERHYTNSLEEVLLDPVLKDWIGEAYSALLVLERKPENSAALATLGRIHSSFDEAAPILHQLLDEVRVRSTHVARFEELQTKLSTEENEAKSLAAKLMTQKKEAKSLAAKLTRQETETESLAAKLKTQESEAKSLAAKLVRQEAEAQSLAAKLVTQRKEAKSLAANLETQENEARDFATRLVAADKELADRVDEIKRRGAEVKTLRENVSNLEAQIAGIYASSSWRLTAPLRFIGERLTWLRRPLGRAGKLAFRLVNLPSRVRAWWRLWRETSLLSRSDLFDRDWYLARYPDVAAAGVDPVRHYLLHGANEGRDPGPDFDTRSYLAQYLDVNAAGINPLAHYLHFGKSEGRMRTPVVKRGAKHNGNLENPARPIDAAHAGSASKYESFWYEAATAQEAGLTFSVAAALRRMASNPEPPVVLVPVYNAVAETEACLQSLVRHTGTGCRIVVIDDASPDPRVRTLLDRYDGLGSIEVVHNLENLGFTGTINRGIGLAGRSDVVFLNSDTQVTPGWLRNLRFAAYSGERVGTATPFSNNAGAFSAPEVGQNNPIPGCVSLDAYARAISQVSLRSYPQAPTGNGFCVYVRRDCIDATGLLDAEAFPRGYGEENDFCMRAGRLGWSHVIDDATLVYHVRSASFGDTRIDLMERGRAVIEARFPEYSGAVREFLGSKRLEAAIKRVRDLGSIIDTETDVRPRVLFVISTRTGGTPQTNEDLMTALNHGVEPFVLHCDSSTLSLMHFRKGSYVTFERRKLREPLRAFPHRSGEYDAVVAEWLAQYTIELIHIRHIAWHGLGLVDVAKDLGLPVVFSFHDFYAVCPTVNLLDERDSYCAGKCTATNGECRYALWGDQSLPPLKHAAIGDWQKQIRATLEKCDAFVTASQSTRRILFEIYPFLRERKFSVIRHGRDFEKFEQAAAPTEIDGTIRILVPGNLSPAKGASIIAELARRARGHRIELHILGALSNSLVRSKFVYHGTYRRSEFASRVKAIKPHIGGVFSICPETYCHTLTELWASGIPVIGFDLGAVGERIRETGAGWLAPEPTAAGVVAIIQELRAHPADYARKVAAVRSWQETEGKIRDCAHMADGYLKLYASLLPGIAAGKAGARRSPRLADRRRFIAAHLPVQNNGLPSATSFVRGIQPLRHAQVSREFDIGELASASAADVMFIIRNAISTLKVAELLTEKRAWRTPFVLDLDDALFDLGKHADSAVYGETLPLLMRVLAEADEVWTTTEYLAARLNEYNGNVHVIPNALDEELWELSAIEASPPRGADGPLRLLYMGSRTHRDDVLPAFDALAPLHKEGRIEVAIVRGIPPLDIPKWVQDITPPETDVYDYTSFVRWFIGLRGQFDLGFAPLEDTEFNRCKSPLKLFDYAGIGLPTVCSDVGPYKADQFPAFRVSGPPAEWGELIDHLGRHRDAILERRRLAIAELQRRGTLGSLGGLRLERLNALVG